MKERLIWLIPTGGLFCAFGYLLVTGNLGLVINPRFPVLYWVAVFLLAVVVAGFFLSPPLSPPRSGILLLVFPLAFFPGLFPGRGGASLVKSRPFVLTEPAGDEREAPEAFGFLGAAAGLPSPDTEAASESPLFVIGSEAGGASVPERPRGIGNEWAEAVQRRYFPTDPAIIPEKDPIELDGRNFFARYYELYDRYERYIGREVILAAFVHRNEEVRNERFLLSRMVMWCCTADTYAIGFIAYGMDTEKLKEGTWIRVRGIVEETEYTGESGAVPYHVPGLRIIEFAVTSPPEEPFVNPDF